MPTGMRTTYSDTNIRARVVADAISMIDYESAPLLKVLGVQNQSGNKFRFRTWPTTKPEILEDSMAPQETTLASGYSTTGTSLAVASGTGKYFRKYHLVEIDSERFLVTAVSGDTLTVTYAYQGTTNANHSSGATVTIVGIAAPEGGDPITGFTTELSNPYNYTQILSETVSVSRTAQKNATYGITDQLAYQVGKLFSQNGQAGLLAQKLAQTFYKGKRNEDTSNEIRTMGGFDTFVTTNVLDLAGVAPQRSHLENMLEDIVNAGGMPDKLVVGSSFRRYISAWYEDSIRTERSEEMGGAMITKVQTDFLPPLEVIFDWMSPRGDCRIVDSKKCGWCEFDPFDIVDLAIDGDRQRQMIVGEYTFLLANQKAHGVLKNGKTL